MRPLFGFHMPSFTFPDTPAAALFDRVAELALAAERAGFDIVTVMDHFYQIRGVGRETEPMLEAYTTLGGLAARTSRIRLAALVTGVTYRNPALVAKIVTTLDIVSKGRAILGFGAAWNESEHRGYGFEFPPIGERMDRLDEALTICRAMFREERASFEGRFYRVTDAINEPRPVQEGGPPIIVGGGGERRTLRLVARHADMSHWFPLGLDVLRHKTQLLERYCEEIGRDPSTIVRTMGSPVLVAADEASARRAHDALPPERRAVVQAATPSRAAELLRPYLEAGFRGFFFSDQMLPTPESVEAAGELIRLLS